jgi:hypothetical protein
MPRATAENPVGVGGNDQQLDHVVAKCPVTSIEIDEVARAELIETDPVHVMGSDPHIAFLTRPGGPRIMPRPCEQHLRAHPLTNHGLVMESRYPEPEIDAAYGPHQLGRRGEDRWTRLQPTGQTLPAIQPLLLPPFPSRQAAQPATEQEGSQEEQE